MRPQIPPAEMEPLDKSGSGPGGILWFAVIVAVFSFAIADRVFQARADARCLARGGSLTLDVHGHRVCEPGDPTRSRD